MKRRRRRSATRGRHLASEASYLCQACGETIVIPVDPSAGNSQTFIEDCPVCCRAHTIHLEIPADGQPHAWAELE